MNNRQTFNKDVSKDEDGKVDVSLTTNQDFRTNLDFDDVVRFAKDRPFNDPCYHSKSDKLRKLGWKPKLSIKEGIIKTVKYLNDNKWVFKKRK